MKKRRKMNPHRRGRKKKSIGIAGLILLFMAFFGAIGGSTEAKKGTGPAAEMQVHFMDVGQGDATLLHDAGKRRALGHGLYDYADLHGRLSPRERKGQGHEGCHVPPNRRRETRFGKNKRK